MCNAIKNDAQATMLGPVVYLRSIAWAALGCELGPNGAHHFFFGVRGKPYISPGDGRVQSRKTSYRESRIK